ncbi:hypothetical protein [Mesorhizobium carmichaelinearum]|uniref:hypothetical protein n=1 Tax=Mesorhizobium carmichaelinearum TaxID=1208188 RepID=UPI000BA43248|nr:hypothetical protein [Mesorhizobium carmichaelinearum]
MRERLALLGQIEFHVAEMVNPKPASTWRSVSISDRIAALHFLSSLIEQAEASMRYAWLSRGQYTEMRGRWAQEGNEQLTVDRNNALKRFVLRSLMEELHSEGKPALIAIDQDRPRSGIEDRCK